jgi:hypothetical protein
MPALLPVKKNFSSPLCLKLRITLQSVTCDVTGYKTANAPAHREPPQRGLSGLVAPNVAAMRWRGSLGPVTFQKAIRIHTVNRDCFFTWTSQFVLEA